MSSFDRELDGATMLFDLAAEGKEMGAVAPGHHTARTLLKSGPLRLTLLTLAPGGLLTEHAAAGPIAVHPLEGTVHFDVDGTVHDVAPGQVFAVGAHVRHTASSREGATFLLTVAMPDTANSALSVENRAEGVDARGPAAESIRSDTSPRSSWGGTRSRRWGTGARDGRAPRPCRVTNTDGSSPWRWLH